jgi:hypothetical protein
MYGFFSCHFEIDRMPRPEEPLVQHAREDAAQLARRGSPPDASPLTPVSLMEWAPEQRAAFLEHRAGTLEDLGALLENSRKDCGGAERQQADQERTLIFWPEPSGRRSTS